MRSNSSAGHSGRPAATSVMPPSSICGSASTTRRSAPSLSTSAMNSRRSLYIQACPRYWTNARQARLRRYNNARNGRAKKMTAGSNVKAHIAYDDLREWLARAEGLGEVKHLKGATWQEDIGLVAEAILRAENGPWVVFDDVPGCPKG